MLFKSECMKIVKYLNSSIKTHTPIDGIHIPKHTHTDIKTNKYLHVSVILVKHIKTK